MRRNTRDYIDRKRKSVSGNLTERDERILEHLTVFEVLTDYQIQRLEFASNRDDHQLKSRMSLLFHQGYVNRLNRDGFVRYKSNLYWLTRKGDTEVSQRIGTSVGGNRSSHTPDFSGLSRTILLNDLILQISEASSLSNRVSLVSWSKDPGESYIDRYIQLTARQDDTERLVRAHSMLILNNSIHANMLFADQVIKPGVAFIRSQSYKDRYGSNTGLFLIVTHTLERAEFLKRAIEVAEPQDASIFFISPIEYLSSQSLLHAPIWLRGGSDGYYALFV